MTGQGPTNDELQVILYQAFSEPIGLELEVSDFIAARQRLYRARELAKDPDLAILQFRASPFIPGNLVIVKGALPGSGMGAAGTPALPPPATDLLD